MKRIFLDFEDKIRNDYQLINVIHYEHLIRKQYCKIEL